MQVLEEDNIAVALVRVAVFIMVLEREYVSVGGAFTAASATQERSGPTEEARRLDCAARMHAFVAREAASMVRGFMSKHGIEAGDDSARLGAHLDSAAQRGVGRAGDWDRLAAIDGLVEKAKAELADAIATMYMTGTANRQQEGIFNMRVVFGCKHTTGGQPSSVSPMLMPSTITVKLPVAAGAELPNFMYYPQMARYLKTEWLPKLPLFSRGVVPLIETALRMKLSDNNMSIEGITRHAKIDQRAAEFGKDTGEYILRQYRDMQQSAALAITQQEQLGATLRASQARRKRRASNQPEESEAAETWSKVSRSVQVREAQLRSDLDGVFAHLGCTSNLSAQVRVVGEWAKGNNESKPITRHMLGSFMAQKRQRTLPKNIFNLLSLFAHAHTA